MLLAGWSKTRLPPEGRVCALQTAGICVSPPEPQQCRGVCSRPHRPSEMHPPGGQLPSEAEKAPWSRSSVVPCVPHKKHRKEKFL